MRRMSQHSQPAHLLVSSAAGERGYDPELMIVECALCGSPVLWEAGRSTAVLASVGIDPLELDARCLLLTDGCPHCRPRRKEGFGVQVFRLMSAQGKDLGLKDCGNA